MIIANPIYDVVFKRLMQNKRIATFFIETLLEETILDIELRPQEYIVQDVSKTLFPLAVSRYDFIATIRTAEGPKKVLIEIQKSPKPDDLMRFRKYLAEQYKSEDEMDTEFGKIRTSLPIVTIYLLGFELSEIDAAAVRVARQYTDLQTHEPIKQKSDFIENLSHDCYVVQLTKIQSRVRTSLEEMLSVFEQNNFVDGSRAIKQYNHPITNEFVKSMVDLLHYEGTNTERRKEIEGEQELWQMIESVGGIELQKLRLKNAHDEKIIKETNKALEEKNKALEAERKVNEALAAELAELKKRLNS
jgi:septal ring factor EnvC (AmiA/AmiB activator)